MQHEAGGQARAVGEGAPSWSHAGGLEQVLRTHTHTALQDELSVLTDWLHTQSGEHSSMLTTEVSGGQVEKLVNVAQAGLVLVQPSLPLPLVTSLERIVSCFVGNGLLALCELMQTAVVRTAVAAFQADFRDTRQQITLLATYKDLHDLLHKLQFHCYDCLVHEARREVHNAIDWDILIEYALTLESVVQDGQEIADRAVVAPQDTQWLDTLKQAQQHLEGAIEYAAPKSLKQAIWLIHRVLAVQPSQINTRMNAAARMLRLAELETGMQAVRDHLAQLDLNAEKVHEFNVGLDALTALNRHLAALIREHDQWQAVDVELRRIEATLSHDLLELELFWLDLRGMVEPLYCNIEQRWAISLATDSEKLEQAISMQDPTKVKQAFRRYRRVAGDRFYRVDMILKRLCDDLRNLGEPLALMLRMLE